MAAPEIITFGCRLNAYESEVMRDLATRSGAADTIIINSCAVTAEAERQARQAVRRARRQNPDARIIVTGCAAQIDPKRFSDMPEVDLVLGNEEKLDPRSYGGEPSARIVVDDIMAVRETAPHLIQGFEGRTRAFVQVQQGCDHRCTFCIIPYGRGNSRSVPIGAIVTQVQTLVENGYAEIVLTGVDITSYGSDLPGQPSLGQMVRRLLRLVPDLKRLRLSSLDPVEIDDDLWRTLAEEPRLMPHLHLSVQAGSDLILKRMKRRHLRADVVDVCARARSLRPDTLFGADLIAGFPTETEDDFAQSLDLVERCDLTYLHVFPYSPRPGTPAAKMPQVAGQDIKVRASRLRALGDATLDRYLASVIGQDLAVLVEQPGFGRTATYAPVRFSGESSVAGQICPVRVTGREAGELQGQALFSEAA